jgi:hypothetical protein
MKKKTVFGTVLLALFVLQTQTVFANGESESSSSQRPVPPPPPPKWKNVVLAGEQEPMLEGTTWDYISTDHDFLLKYEFRAGGRMVQDRIAISRKNGSEWEAQGSLNNNSWQREGDIIKLTFNNGFIYAEGKYYPDTKKIMGLAEDSDGNKADFTMSPVGSFTPPPSLVASTSPSPSYSNGPSPSNSSASGTNNANSGNAIANAFRSPLQSGTYSLAGTQAKIRLTAIAKSGVFSYTNRQGGTGTGSYNIDGNRMTIQMEGYTLVYTVTSETSFSGSGETWVRTGY